MKLIKLTDENGRTRNNTQWGPGVTHTAPGTGKMCAKGWIHAYTDPYLALLMNPIHGNFSDPQMWIAKGEIGITDGLKVGCASLTTIRQRRIPKITTEMRVRFGIFCALEVYNDAGFRQWAENWMSGKDCSASAARAAESAAASAAESAAERAAETGKKINFVALAMQACKKEAQS